MSQYTRRNVCTLVVMLLLMIVSPMVMAQNEQSSPILEFNSLKELEGKKIGFITGSIFETVVSEKMPYTGEHLFFSSLADTVAALKAGKVDAACNNLPGCTLAVSRINGIAILPEYVSPEVKGFIFPKGSTLTAQMDAVLDKFKADGVLDALRDKWLNGDNSAKTLPEQVWLGQNGTIRAIASGIHEPLDYMGDDGVLTGYDVELALLIAKELDMKIEFTVAPFDAILASVQSKKVDMGLGSITITEERKQSVDFSQTIFESAVVLIVRTSAESSTKTPGMSNIWSNLNSSFKKTFIVENRWKMILSGFGYTLLISAVAGILGVLLGFLLVIVRRKEVRGMKIIISCYTALMSGLPIVVILMVLYYIVFGSMNIPGILVAIIGFGLSFGSRSYGIIWNAVQAINLGQEEAALALGYSREQAFRKVILPQAHSIYVPLLQSQFVSLVKETSVAGYITVIDLTRAGDLIRSRTMEAFFPLIAIALIYFILTWSLSMGIKMLQSSFDLNKRPRKIQGVDAL